MFYSWPAWILSFCALARGGGPTHSIADLVNRDLQALWNETHFDARDRHGDEVKADAVSIPNPSNPGRVKVSLALFSSNPQADFQVRHFGGFTGLIYEVEGKPGKIVTRPPAALLAAAVSFAARTEANAYALAKEALTKQTRYLSWQKMGWKHRVTYVNLMDRSGPVEPLWVFSFDVDAKDQTIAITVDALAGKVVKIHLGSA